MKKHSEIFCKTYNSNILSSSELPAWWPDFLTRDLTLLKVFVLVLRTSLTVTAGGGAVAFKFPFCCPVLDNWSALVYASTCATWEVKWKIVVKCLSSGPVGCKANCLSSWSNKYVGNTEKKDKLSRMRAKDLVNYLIQAQKIPTWPPSIRYKYNYWQNTLLLPGEQRKEINVQMWLTSDPVALPLSAPSALWTPSALPLTPSWGLVASRRTWNSFHILKCCHSSDAVEQVGFDFESLDEVRSGERRNSMNI